MGRTALVTGSAARVEPVADALVADGVTVVRATTGPELAGIVASIVAGVGPGGIDLYVQLPVELAPTGDTVVSRAGEFLRQGLLARFAETDEVLPLLSPDASVLLVTGHTMAGRDVPDDHNARIAMLRVLTHAIRADRAPSRVRVTIVDGSQPPAQIARAAQERSSPDRAARAAQPEREYEDWRAEVLGLAEAEF